MISFQSFVDHIRNEELVALGLGLKVETHRDGVKWVSVPTEKVLRTSNSAPTLSSSSPMVGAGFSRQRLRKELQKEREKLPVDEPPKSAVKKKKKAFEDTKKQPRKRGLLRHEITELRGAGILLTEGQIFHTMRTVAQDSWRHPNPVQPATLA